MTIWLSEISRIVDHFVTWKWPPSDASFGVYSACMMGVGEWIRSPDK